MKLLYAFHGPRFNAFNGPCSVQNTSIQKHLSGICSFGIFRNLFPCVGSYLFVLIFCLGVQQTSHAQGVPDNMNYQAVIRDTSGELITLQMMGVQVSIHRDSANGLLVFQEYHQASSNAQGLLNLNIGGGNIQFGALAQIDWTSAPYFIVTEIDPAGGTNFNISSANPLKSVPYALQAKKSADNVWKQNGNAIYNINTGSVGIGTNAPHPSALLELKDSSKGLLIPRLSFEQRQNMTNPAEGLLVFQYDSVPGFYTYIRDSWQILAAQYSPNFITRKDSFQYTGALQTFIVPEGVSQISMRVYGGQGGYGRCRIDSGSCGLNAPTSWGPTVEPGYFGSAQHVVIPVTQGDTLQLQVGGWPSESQYQQLPLGGGIPGAYPDGASGSITQTAIPYTYSYNYFNWNCWCYSSAQDNCVLQAIVAPGAGGGSSAVTHRSTTGTNTLVVRSKGGQGSDAYIPFWTPVAGFAGGGSDFVFSSAIQSSTLAPKAGDGLIVLEYEVGSHLVQPSSSNAASTNTNSLPVFSPGAIPYGGSLGLTESPNQFFYDQTNHRVGIGTSSPLSKLDVSGLGGIKVSTNNPGVGTSDWIGLNIGAVSGNRLVGGIFDGVATLGGHVSGLNNWSALALNPGGGSVGIGVLAPQEKLHVNGYIRSDALAGQNVRMVTVDADGVFKAQSLQTGGTVTEVNVVSPLQVQNSNYTPLISIAQAGPTQNGYLSAADWQNFQAKYNLPALSNGSILFAENGQISQQNSLLHWQSATGRMGLGTSLPQVRFHVEGNAEVQRISGNNPYQTYFSNGIHLGQIGISNNHFHFSTLNNAHQIFSTNGVERMTIQSNGSVGIGISQPQSKLHLGSGSLTIETNNPGSGYTDWVAANLGGSSGDRLVMGLYDGVASIGGHVNNLFAWSKLALNPGGGFVGIGTTQPTQALHVNGNQFLSGAITVQGNANINGIVHTGDLEANTLNSLGNIHANTEIAADGNIISQGVVSGNTGMTTNGQLTSGSILNNGMLTNQGMAYLLGGAESITGNIVSQQGYISAPRVKQTVHSIPFFVGPAYYPPMGVTAPSYGSSSINWTHNLNAYPDIMISIYGSGATEHIRASYEHIDANTIQIRLSNTAVANVSGQVKVILVN